jgi:HMG (high mobility group) box/SAM domain (Sterile alpha motif)
MTELGDIFAELGISHYLQDFLEQGFDTWETILDITESDFDALRVKLGHRRKLQRKIANSRGLSSDRALASPRNTPSDDRQAEETRTAGTKVDSKDGSGPPQGAKRKYRRHPKPDENAPERPPSAYVIFSNKMREELKGRNLSFTEIAKLVGENWQNLAPAEKEPYEQQAFSAKERYNNELAEYKKTTNYKEYAQYLADFKARQSNQQQGTLCGQARKQHSS